MKRILVAYDGSTSSAKAFSLGVELSEKYGAELMVLAVARPPEFGTEVETEAVIENSKRHCHDILRPLHTVVKAAKNPTRFEVGTGHPGEQIVHHAEDWEAELIVVGHRGRTVLDRLLIGSVARYQGKGVRQAVENVETEIATALAGFDPTCQAQIDRAMIELDGTDNKSRLGANAILGVSQDVARAAATSSGLPLYAYLAASGPGICRRR